MPKAKPQCKLNRRKVPFIMQWNCAGIASRMDELNLFLREYQIPILALSEAGLPRQRSITGYVTHKNPSITSFPNGSAAVYIRREVPHVALNVADLCTDVIEVSAIRAQIGNQKVSIASVYASPHKKISIEKFLEDLCHRCPAPRIICGDFNAHHTSWGDKSSDARGRCLESAIDKLDLCIANDGNVTFLRPPACTSIIDLTLHSSDVELTCCTAPDRMGSDHFPIFINVAGYHLTAAKCSKVTDWDRYREHLDHRSGDIFQDMLASKAAATAILKLPAHFPAPDLKLRNLCAARRRAEKKLMRRSGEPALKTQFNRLNAAIRRHTKKLRRKQWAAFCESLSVFAPLSRIWEVVNSVGSTPQPLRPFVALALFKDISMPSLAEEFADVYIIGRESEPPSCLPPHSASAIDAPFTLRELTSAISSLRRRCAPGPDGITNQIISNLPAEARSSLLTYFNYVWELGNIPQTWKMAWVVPVLKPGKDRTELASYRPVSLTSCVAKLMEKLACVRLTWWIENRKSLPACMTGFRQRLSAQDNILDLVSHIEHQRAYGFSTLAIFLDISKAYDYVFQSAIICRLVSMGITGHLLRFVHAFLSDRSIQVKLGTVLSNTRKITRGVPQGSVLSPMLFNVAMAGLPDALKIVSKAVQISIYADDICIWLSGYQHKRLEMLGQRVVLSAQTHLASIGLTISAEKSRFMLFPGMRRRETRMKISLLDAPIQQVKYMRFLGVTLDSRMNWRRAVDKTISALSPRVNILRRMAGTSWGSHPSSMIRLHSAVIVNRVLFQLPLISPCESQ
uniref:Putative tick transposon n=1 Tax=Rhipicephalus pulchellus TaxID=72859 RepID=L7LY18_RHIPC